jgi:hypothetical protein
MVPHTVHLESRTMKSVGRRCFFIAPITQSPAKGCDLIIDERNHGTIVPKDPKKVEQPPKFKHVCYFAHDVKESHAS